MRTPRRPAIVLLGMMTKMPVSGVVWQTVHYLLGFERLGFEAYYVEAHARTPSMLMSSAHDDGARLAASFLERIARRFGFAGRWAFQALHDDGRSFGMSPRQVDRLLREAELVVNLHGGTEPRPEHAATGRLVYVETDPVQLQVELHDGVESAIEFLESHCAFFTFGELYGRPGCGLPVSERFRFRPTRQPIVLDLWPVQAGTPVAALTTVGNWRQHWRDVILDGERYTWSKHAEFSKVLDLPARVPSTRFELALASCDESDRQLLLRHGFELRDPARLSADPDVYRAYVSGSLGELTVAKDQNVRLRTGWFSDRSATYLAAARPVVTQDTGFGEVLPTGEGLHAFADVDGAVAAVERICSDYAAARRSAHEIAREFFDAERVLRSLVEAVGVSAPGGSGPVRHAAPIPADLDLEPVSRRPLRLPEATVRTALDRPVPFGRGRPVARPARSVVVVTHGQLTLTRLCLESVLADPESSATEVVVVDNASTDGTRQYLRTIAARFPRVRVTLERENLGFPRAVNRGLELATATDLLLLNNDTIVPPGWARRLVAHLRDEGVGLVGPVTNRIGNEAEIEAPYRTYGEFLRFAGERARSHAGMAFELPMPAMFCVATRRDVVERVGPLDEGFGLGTLEDDDYAVRARRAGYRLLCAEDVVVHHFGEGSFGELAPDGSLARLLETNQKRFEEKWRHPWRPYERRLSGDYTGLRDHVRHVVATEVPRGAGVIVVSRGDDELLAFPERRGIHFPNANGGFAGHYPADSAHAVAELETLRRQGGEFLVLPKTGFWWLEHYEGFRDHLESRYAEVFRDERCVVFSLRSPA